MRETPPGAEGQVKGADGLLSSCFLSSRWGQHTSQALDSVPGCPPPSLVTSASEITALPSQPSSVLLPLSTEAHCSAMPPRVGGSAPVTPHSTPLCGSPLPPASGTGLCGSAAVLATAPQISDKRGCCQAPEHTPSTPDPEGWLGRAPPCRLAVSCASCLCKVTFPRRTVPSGFCSSGPCP